MKNQFVLFLFAASLTLSASAHAEFQSIQCQLGASNTQSIHLAFDPPTSIEETGEQIQRSQLDLVLTQNPTQNLRRQRRPLHLSGAGVAHHFGLLATRTDADAIEMKSMIEDYLEEFGLQRDLITADVEVSAFSDFSIWKGARTDENYFAIGFGWVFKNVPRNISNTRADQPSSLVYFVLTNGDGQFYQLPAIRNCVIQ